MSLSLQKDADVAAQELLLIILVLFIWLAFFYQFIHLSVSFSNSQVDMGHLFQYAVPCQAPVTSKSDVGYSPLQAAPNNTVTSYDGLLLPETMQVDERNLSASAVPDKTTVTLL